MYMCIASLDVEMMCGLYCTLLYDHIVINVNPPLRMSMIGEINKYNIFKFWTEDLILI